MPKQEQPAIDWIQVRKRVEEGQEPMRQIAKDLGINPSTLYRRKIKWTQANSSDCSSKNASEATATASSSNADHAHMVERLYKAAEQQICHMESRLTKGEASFDEKEARMLGTIARTLDKLMDLAKSSQQNGTNSHEQATDADLDSLRTDLAQRLAQLQR